MLRVACPAPDNPLNRKQVDRSRSDAGDLRRAFDAAVRAVGDRLACLPERATRGDRAAGRVIYVRQRSARRSAAAHHAAPIVAIRAR